MKIYHALPVLAAILVCAQALAHHSFAIYDIDNRISRTGVLTRFEYRQPHIELELLVERDDGSLELWSIESASPRRWEQMGLPREIAEPGEFVTIEGWPARDGRDEMLLSAITTERGRTIVTEEVRQRSAREGIPAVTIKRE